MEAAQVIQRYLKIPLFSDPEVFAACARISPGPTLIWNIFTFCSWEHCSTSENLTHALYFQRFSFWLSSILPVPYESKHEILTCRDTVERLKICIELMKVIYLHVFFFTTRFLMMMMMIPFTTRSLNYRTFPFAKHFTVHQQNICSNLSILC